MSIDSILALALATFLLAATPGPGVFAVLARAMSGGVRSTIFFIVGVVSGDLVFLLLAILGLAVVANLFSEVFQVVKILGGAYLIWLGIKCWRAKAEVTEVSAVRRASAFRDYLGGVFLTLGNPKVILFYIGFLPTFMDLGALSPADIAIACAVVSGALGATMVAYAYLASRARRLLKSERGVRVLNRGSGTVLIGAGAVVATA